MTSAVSDDTRRILDLLAQGKISVDEADRLLKAARAESTAAPDAGSPSASSRAGAATQTAAPPSPARFLRIEVRTAANEWRPEKQVNVRVPLAMVRGGMRLGALVPGTGDRIAQALRERGVDFDISRLEPAQLEALLQQIGEMTIDVDQGRKQVRITCE
jgi:hypothetical protein